ncbi:hypothetical protein AABM38_09590 [Heyndrickxia sp. MSNUG]|uniref:hypothetical protein n=1 Tax=Heyndrickxia sp. MSNUG TaxID=3136677 RepID=UPI003C2EBE74
MFFKVYTYHVKPEREQDFFEIQAQAENVYSRFVEKQSLFLRSKDDNAKWMEIQIYKDENSFNESIKIIDQQKEIIDLYTRFMKLIISKEELIEENYEQILIT